MPGVSADELRRRLVERLQCRRRSCPCRRGSMLHCPAHDDRHPSLSVSVRNERLLVHCFAGCRQKLVWSAIKERGVLRPDDLPPARPTPVVIRTPISPVTFERWRPDARTVRLFALADAIRRVERQIARARDDEERARLARRLTHLLNLAPPEWS